MRRMARAFMAGSLAAIALACDAPEKPGEVIRPVLSMRVADVAAFQESTLPGRARASKEATMAFEVSGRLVERPVDVGDRVERDQLLARIDPRDYEARLVSARGAYRTAKADFDRAVALFAADALAESVRDNRRAALDVADGNLRRAEKAVADTRLVAPFAGTVTATFLENFQNVVAKQQVVRLVDSSRLEMEVAVPESLITLAPLAFDVVVEFDTFPGRLIPAEISEIGDEASAATRTFPVTVVMDPPEDLAIKPGMAGRVTARATLPPDAAEVGIEIPLSALFSPPDDPNKASAVWIVDEENLVVRLRNVELRGLTTRGARVRGIEPLERVVTVGVHHLRDGQPVRIAD
jgi:RND family efflux transporter MFP subunit